MTVTETKEVRGQFEGVGSVLPALPGAQIQVRRLGGILLALVVVLNGLLTLPDLGRRLTGQLLQVSRIKKIIRK